MNNRTRALLLALIILAVVVVAVAITLRAPNKQTQPEPPSVVVKRPELLPSIDRSLGVAGSPTDFGLSSQLTPVEAPVALPIYRVNFAPAQSTARLVAAGLGFLGSPSVDSRALPSLWSWSEGNKTLVAQIDTPTVISFQGTPRSVSASRIDNEQAKMAAENFLRKQYNLPSPMTLLFASSTEIAINNAGAPSIEGANYRATIVSFHFALDGHRIFFELRDKPSATVFVDGVPEAYRATFVFPPVTLVKGEERALADETVAVSSIKTKGVLVGVEKKSASLSEKSGTPDFTNVSIVKSELVYFYEKTLGALVPAYLFTGEGTKPGKDPLTTLFLVRATD